MYLDRPGMTTIRKKLDARETMTFNEYVVAYLKMIRDPRAEQGQVIDKHIEHIQQIVQDASVREWAVVRKWSQSIFDAIEGGQLTWQDRREIQIQRLTHAVMANRLPPSGGRIDRGIERRDLP